jgi:hypothetical protein
MAKAHPRSILRYEGNLCAGHLLVWTSRKMVGGHGEYPVLAWEYDRFAGDQADALLAAFATFLVLLGRGSRRVLHVGPLHCAGLTADEERMLRLIAAAQTGERILAAAHLTWLVRRDARDDVMETVEKLAEALTKAGVILPPVRTCTPARSATLDRMSVQGWI